MNGKNLYLLLTGILFLSCSNKKDKPQTTEVMSNELTMIAGTYTSGSSQGIYTFRFNQQTGEWKALSEVEISNPSYLTISDNSQFVYAVSEQNDGSEEITAFRLDKTTGTLKQINSVPAMGTDPCYITNVNNHIITANYSGGNITVFPTADDGSLLPASDIIHFEGAGQDKERQTKPHLHCVHTSPDGRFLLAVDLGTDQIHLFEINSNATPKRDEKLLHPATPNNVRLTPGSGPRHIIFSTTGKQAYLINELSGEVTAFNYNNGKLFEIQHIQSDTVGARGSADIQISPDGKFLYASNRLIADGLAIFGINPSDGKLTKVGYQPTGAHPRNFVITPNGNYLLVASRDNNMIEIYKRDKDLGILFDTSQRIPVDKPVCLMFAL